VGREKMRIPSAGGKGSKKLNFSLRATGTFEPQRKRKKEKNKQRKQPETQKPHWEKLVQLKTLIYVGRTKTLTAEGDL